MKFKIYKSLAMCTLLLGLAACNDFEEMNTDPYAPVYDPEIIGATPDGIDIDYETVGKDGSMLMVSVSGTAVKTLR